MAIFFFLKKLSFSFLCLPLFLKIVFFTLFEKNFGTPNNPLTLIHGHWVRGNDVVLQTTLSCYVNEHLYILDPNKPIINPNTTIVVTTIDIDYPKSKIFLITPKVINICLTTPKRCFSNSSTPPSQFMSHLNYSL